MLTEGMEYWSNGMMEYWNNGLWSGFSYKNSIIPIL
jgi:hypothetical protein